VKIKNTTFSGLGYLPDSILTGLTYYG